jgi:predicted NBD/HSP70 family sugar kinase
MSTEPRPADQQSIRRHNLSLIARAVSGMPGSRAELSQRTGLTKATVSSLVDSLLAHGILAEGEPAPARVGRPARPVSLNPAGPVAVGLEINVDYLAGCRTDLTGAVQAHCQLAIDNRRRSAASILDQICGLAAELCPAGQPLLGMALAVPGVVGSDRRLLRVPNLPRLAGQPLAEQLGQRLPTALIPEPVLMDNEANFGALGWLRRPVSGLCGWPVGAAAERDFVYVSGEIGVGAGLVVGGALFRGAAGFAGELGHVVVERDGPACGCGGRGCVEQYAGLQVLLRDSGQPSLAALIGVASSGDQRARAAIAAAGSALGVGLASLLNVVDLPRVVLGGVYAPLFELITPALQAELDRRVLSGSGIGLARSSLGTEAAVLGAAGAVVEQALADPGALSAR